MVCGASCRMTLSRSRPGASRAAARGGESNCRRAPPAGWGLCRRRAPDSSLGGRPTWPGAIESRLPRRCPAQVGPGEAVSIAHCGVAAGTGQPSVALRPARRPGAARRKTHPRRHCERRPAPWGSLHPSGPPWVLQRSSTQGGMRSERPGLLHASQQPQEP
eukprot:scaffold874_cov380-Prasinococcus_capsulatus_cf.AAC.31